jgi:hypothetical protein
MFRVLIVSLLSVSVAFADSSRRTIEDRDLVTVSGAAERAIRSHPEGRDYADCQFKGAALKIPDDSAREVFVTTTDVCAWGASQGPILILKEGKGTFTVLLHTIGYSAESLSIDGQRQHGLRVDTGRSTTEYRFDAGRYIKVKTTFHQWPPPDPVKAEAE